MEENHEGVRAAFQRAESIPPESDDGPRMIDEGDDGGSDPGSFDTGLPPGFPVQPLGMAAGKFHFLTARGEQADLSAGAMTNRANLVALVAGAPDPLDCLAGIAPPAGRRDQGFNPSKAADRLMQACSALPLYDASMSMRHFGTWRGTSQTPVIHLGERVVSGPDEEVKGRMISKALYPAVPSRASPSNEIASAEDLEWVRERLNRFWSWDGENDSAILIGWIGQAVLGQYPSWRTHMYVKGRHGSGKTTVTRLVSALLGGMSTGVKNSTSAAAIRQTTNRMAIARVFDEAEADESGSVSDVIALFRLMSDAEGAQVEKGTSDHSGIRFELYGAGYLASIIPAAMTSADRSRFVILSMGERPEVSNPATSAALLEELQLDATELGPKVWARMLALAPGRWDKTFRMYNSLVQSLGARARSGDTIGAILAGWDLMLFDNPLVNPETGAADVERMERATAIAQPLIDVAQEAEEEGEGERCLRTIFAATVQKDHGGIITIAELLDRMQDSHSDPDEGDNRYLGRLGLRLLPGERQQRVLFVANGQNPLLDRALSGTRWRAGGHRAALDTIDDVHPSAKPMRVQGRPSRGLLVPARFLPGGEESSAEVGRVEEK